MPATTVKTTAIHASYRSVRSTTNAGRRRAGGVRRCGLSTTRAVASGFDEDADYDRTGDVKDAGRRRGRREMLATVAIVTLTAAKRAGAEEETNVAVVDGEGERQTKAARALAKKSVKSDALAYEFEYSIEAESGKPINWAVSRERDTYSSAEPMSPNARQRIVYELLSFKGPLTTVVTVSPLPPALEGKTAKEWTAKQVANAVLADKATGRVASGQRVSLAEVDNAKKEEIDGANYFYYEYISQGSPNLREPEATTFRHSYGVTVERDGYLYTLSSSAPEIYWDELNRGFDESIKSFRLVKPTKKYRAPGNEGLGISLPFSD
jgi:hypothetical protein